MESWGWNLFEQVDEKMGDDWKGDYRQCFQGELAVRSRKTGSNQNDFLFFLKQKTLEQVSFLIVVIQGKDHLGDARES